MADAYKENYDEDSDFLPEFLPDDYLTEGTEASGTSGEDEVENEVFKILFANTVGSVGSEKNIKFPSSSSSRLAPNLTTVNGEARLRDAQKAAREARKEARGEELPEVALANQSGVGGKSYTNDIPDDISTAKLDTFFKQVRGGCPLDTAIAYARIPQAQVKLWFERGVMDSDSWYGRFLEEYEYCRAHWEVKHIQQLQKKARHPNNWRANLELLKIQRAGNWAPEQKPQGQNPPNTNVLILNGSSPEKKQIETLTLEQINALTAPKSSKKGLE